MSPLTKKLLALGTSSVIAVTGGYLVGPFEGKRNEAYLDVVGIPTICWGETKGVKLGDKYSDEHCDASLATELSVYNEQMKRNVKVALAEHEEVAYTSFVYNVGVGAWNSSTLLKKLNSGDREGACAQLLRWNKAGGKTVQGLVNRREAEYKVCMGGNADVNKALAQLSTDGDEALSVGENAPETIKTGEEVLTPSPQEINVSGHDTQATKTSPEPSCVKKFLFWCLKYNS